MILLGLCLRLCVSVHQTALSENHIWGSMNLFCTLIFFNSIMSLICFSKTLKLRQKLKD